MSTPRIEDRSGAADIQPSYCKRFWILQLLLVSVKGHGNLVKPDSWFGPPEPFHTPWSPERLPGTIYFTNETYNEGGPTITADSYLITFPDEAAKGVSDSHPWRAPGTAMVCTRRAAPQHFTQPS